MYVLAVSERRTPEITDPRWEAWCVPLFDFLSEPRGWKTLIAWSKARKFGGAKLRHCMAWLEERGRATTFMRDDEVLWVQTAWVVESESD